MGQDWHLDTEEWRDDGGPEQRLVALVVGVSDERDTTGQQFRPRRIDVHRAGVVGAIEGDAVIGAGTLAVLEFGLGDGRSKVDIPERRRFGRVDLLSRHHLEERALADRLGLLGDRRVLEAPVDADPDRPPQFLEGFFIDGGQFDAQLDEVLSRDGDLVLAGLLRGTVLRVVGEGRVAAHAVEVLHPALGRQSVVVPSHRIEDVLAPHAPEPRDDVGVRVTEDVSDVQRPRHGRGRRVDRIDALSRGVAIEAVDLLLVPHRHPTLFEPVDGRLLGHLTVCGGEGVFHGWRSLEQ